MALPSPLALPSPSLALVLVGVPEQIAEEILEPKQLRRSDGGHDDGDDDANLFLYTEQIPLPLLLRLLARLLPGNGVDLDSPVRRTLLLGKGVDLKSPVRRTSVPHATQNPRYSVFSPVNARVRTCPALVKNPARQSRGE